MGACNNDPLVRKPAKHLSPELISILTVGVALAGLTLTGLRGVRTELQGVRAELNDVRTDVTELGERVARLEGLFEGLIGVFGGLVKNASPKNVPDPD